MAKRELPLKEKKKMVEELGMLLNIELKKELKEAEELIKMKDIFLPTMKSKQAIKKLVKASTIDIPIHELLSGELLDFSEEDLESIAKVKEIKRNFGLTQEELSRILGVSLRTVAYWLNFASAPRRLAQDRISKVHKVNQAIWGVIKPQAIRKWLFADNEILGDSIFHLLEKGEYEKVLADIEALKEGVFA